MGKNEEERDLEKFVENEDSAMLQNSSDRRVQKEEVNWHFLVNEINEDLGFHTPERHGMPLSP